MTSTTFLIGLILLGIALIAILMPYVHQMRARTSDLHTALTQKERDELLTNYERVLAAIRDLDEDFRTGKFTQATYEQERAEWTERGVDLLQQLEADGIVTTRDIAATIQQHTAADDQARHSADTADVDQAIEQLLADYRQQRA